MDQLNPHMDMFKYIASRLRRGDVNDRVAIGYLAASWGIPSDIMMDSMNVSMELTIFDCGGNKLKTIKAIRDVLGGEKYGLRSCKLISEGSEVLTLQLSEWNKLQPVLDAMGVEYGVKEV